MYEVYITFMYIMHMYTSIFLYICDEISQNLLQQSKNRNIKLITFLVPGLCFFIKIKIFFKINFK